MRSIVEEVMNKQPKSSSQNMNPIKAEPTKQQDSNILQSINRPNYQRKNLEKRLASLPGDREVVKPKSSHTSNQSSHSSDFNRGSLSQLSKMALVQGKVDQKNQIDVRPVNNHHTCKVNKLGEGLEVFVFPEVHDQLTSFFNRSHQANSIAVFKGSQSMPSQLVIVNELMRKYPDMKYFIKWDKGTDQPFLLELYEQDFQRLEEVVSELTKRLLEFTSNKVNGFTLSSPGPWLSNRLDLTLSVKSVGIIEGLNYYQNIMVLDRYFKQLGEKRLAVDVKDTYMLIKGDSEDVQPAVESMVKMAEQVEGI